MGGASDVKEQLPFSDAEFSARLAAVQAGMNAAGMDALVVTAPENIYYLSAFHTAAYDLLQALVVPQSGAPVLVNIIHESEYLVPFRSWVTEKRAYSKTVPFLDTLATLLEELGVARGRIGVEKTCFFLTVRDFEGLQTRLPWASFVDSGGIVERGRAVK
jgi:Xaa-Pro dipeptidase